MKPGVDPMVVTVDPIVVNVDPMVVKIDPMVVTVDPMNPISDVDFKLRKLTPLSNER